MSYKRSPDSYALEVLRDEIQRLKHTLFALEENICPECMCSLSINLRSKYYCCNCCAFNGYHEDQRAELTKQNKKNTKDLEDAIYLIRKDWLAKT